MQLQVLDAEVGRHARDSVHAVHAFGMPGVAFLEALLRPASVAVHDNGHMLR